MIILVPAALYLLFINAAAIFLYGLDKWKAVQGRWRIRESVLIGIAVAGGSAGALFGMLLFHHKTRKPLFMRGVPCILLLQAAACGLLLLWW